MTMNRLPRVLFVDDEPQLLEAIEDALRRQFDIVTATSGAEGVRKLETQGPFSVVVSDFQMPGMNGAQFLAKARVVAPSCVRVLLTGQASVQGAIAAVNEGNVFRFLTKPCAPPELRRALEDALEQARLVTADRELLEHKLENMSGHLRRTERLASLGTMAGAIGHELNNVLGVFSASLSMIREDLAAGRPPNDEDFAALDHVKKHLSNHARNLLDYGRPPVSTTTTELGDAIREGVALLRAAAVFRRIDLQLTLPEVPIVVEADNGEIAQVVLNLIKNAAEAALEAHDKDRRKPRVSVELRIGDTATCTVRDNGTGIPRANLPLIFEPYFTTKSADRGTGLGLFVVKQIIEKFRGTLGVDSTEGIGTAFTFAFPLATDSDRADA